MKTGNLTGMLFLKGKEHVEIEIATYTAEREIEFSEIILENLKIKPKRILKQTTFQFLSVDMKYC